MSLLLGIGGADGLPGGSLGRVVDRLIQKVDPRRTTEAAPGANTTDFSGVNARGPITVAMTALWPRGLRAFKDFQVEVTGEAKLYIHVVTQMTHTAELLLGRGDLSLDEIQGLESQGLVKFLQSQHFDFSSLSREQQALLERIDQDKRPTKRGRKSRASEDRVLLRYPSQRLALSHISSLLTKFQRQIILKEIARGAEERLYLDAEQFFTTKELRQIWTEGLEATLAAKKFPLDSEQLEWVQLVDAYLTSLAQDGISVPRKLLVHRELLELLRQEPLAFELQEGPVDSSPSPDLADQLALSQPSAPQADIAPVSGSRALAEELQKLIEFAEEHLGLLSEAELALLEQGQILRLFADKGLELSEDAQAAIRLLETDWASLTRMTAREGTKGFVLEQGTVNTFTNELRNSITGARWALNHARGSTLIELTARPRGLRPAP